MDPRPATPADVEETLGLLEERLAAAQTLPGHHGGREGLTQAIARARAQLAGQAPQILTIALAGGTGSGKITLINALAGAPIAQASHRRPTTERIHVYHHRDVPRSGFPRAVAAQAEFIAHDREELRHKVIVDTPDLDSFIREHRALTLELLKAAGLVLYVFTAEKYLNADILSVVREEQRFSRCAAVLNKIDLLGSPAEIEQLTADLRAHFASIGQESLRVFRTCARQHLAPAAPSGAQQGAPAAIGAVADDFATLRQFIEQELRESDIEQMRRAQQARVLGHLEAQLDRLAPPDLPARLGRFIEDAASDAGEAADHLAAALAPRLAQIDAELAPLAVIAQHHRFWGPLRAWLAASDFIRFGLAGLARRFAGATTGIAEGRAIERLLGADSAATLTQILRALAQLLQDRLYHEHLPLGLWPPIVARHAPEDAAGALAEEIRALYLSGALARRGGRLTQSLSAFAVHALSGAGLVVTIGLIGLGLYYLVWETIQGVFGGMNVVAHFAAVLILAFALLQGIGDLLLARRPRLGRQAGSRAIAGLIRRWCAGWTDEYQAAIETEWRALREPAERLRPLLEHHAAPRLTARDGAEPPFASDPHGDSSRPEE